MPETQLPIETSLVNAPGQMLEVPTQRGREWSRSSWNFLRHLTGRIHAKIDSILSEESEPPEPVDSILSTIVSDDFAALAPKPKQAPQSEAASRNGDELRQLTGPQGSNEGGWFENQQGERYYVKFYSDPDRARVEYIACQIYKELDIPVPDVEVRIINGKVAILSREIPGAKKIDPLTMSQQTQILRSFVADAFLGNRDVTGSAFDNIIHGNDGRFYRIDNGGSLVFRARGARKDFPSDTIVELDTMRNPMYPAGMVFSAMREEQIHLQARDLVSKLSDDRIDAIVHQSGIENNLANQIKDSLKGRRQYLISRFNLPKQDSKQQEKSTTTPDLELIGNPDILEIWDTPSRKSVCGASFRTESFEGIPLQPNQAILVKVPAHIQESLLDQITIHHRKAEVFRSSIDANGWDSEGAYTRVLVWDSQTQKWYGWRGTDFIGGDKFAEPRSATNPESEILYDWIATAGDIKPEFVMIIGAGKGKRGIVNFHGVDLETFPKKERKKIEFIFSPGTSFVDPKKQKLKPSFGGGEYPYMGLYPGSIPLNHPDTTNIRFPTTRAGEGFILDKKTHEGTGDLHIPISQAISFERIEVAIGDTEDYDGKVYKRGETFRRGWAKLSVFIKRRDGSKVEVMRRVNIPPRGVLKGAPENSLNLEQGDEIILQAQDDAAYLMGVRIQ